MKKEFFEKIEELKYKKDYIISNAYGLTGYGDNDKTHKYILDVSHIISQWAKLLTAKEFLNGESFKEEINRANKFLTGNYIDLENIVEEIITDMEKQQIFNCIIINKYPNFDEEPCNGKI